MKKIFILTGEASGDKLASKVISKLKKDNLNIDYLSVGGESLKALGIKSIYNLKEITYIGFTNVISNIFKMDELSFLAIGFITLLFAAAGTGTFAIQSDKIECGVNEDLKSGACVCKVGYTQRIARYHIVDSHQMNHFFRNICIFLE